MLIKSGQVRKSHKKQAKRLIGKPKMLKSESVIIQHRMLYVFPHSVFPEWHQWTALLVPEHIQYNVSADGRWTQTVPLWDCGVLWYCVGTSVPGHGIVFIPPPNGKSSGHFHSQYCKKWSGSLCPLYSMMTFTALKLCGNNISFALDLYLLVI